MVRKRVRERERERERQKERERERETPILNLAEGDTHVSSEALKVLDSVAGVELELLVSEDHANDQCNNLGRSRRDQTVVNALCFKLATRKPCKIKHLPQS